MAQLAKWKTSKKKLMSLGVTLPILEPLAPNRNSAQPSPKKEKIPQKECQYHQKIYHKDYQLVHDDEFHFE